MRINLSRVPDKRYRPALASLEQEVRRLGCFIQVLTDGNVVVLAKPISTKVKKEGSLEVQIAEHEVELGPKVRQRLSKAMGEKGYAISFC